MSDYPKLMFKGGEEITVTCPEEEQAQAVVGFRAVGQTFALDDPSLPIVDPEPLSDPPTFGPPDDGTGDEPTEGPRDDDTHAKRSKKKK